MAANMRNSDIAIEASIMIVRAFVRLKDLAQEHSELRRRFQMLEQRVASDFPEHAEELPELGFIRAKLEQPRETKKGKLGL